MAPLFDLDPRISSRTLLGLFSASGGCQETPWVSEQLWQWEPLSLDRVGVASSESGCLHPAPTAMTPQDIRHYGIGKGSLYSQRMALTVTMRAAYVTWHSGQTAVLMKVID